MRVRDYLNHKATVGYVLLAVGIGYAVNGNSEAIHESRDRGKISRGVICNILTQTDEQTIEQLPATSKLLHIPMKTLKKYEADTLKRSAHYRHQLGPSTPASACEHGITTVKKKAKKHA